jgi:DNA-directed RNA polymerase beta' subunit
MTFSGEINPINRFGLGKAMENTLVMASFERTLETLFSSSSRNLVDRDFGVSESIILGKKPPIGTGLCGVKNYDL